MENFFIDGDSIFHGLESIKSTLHYTDDQILASTFKDKDLLTVTTQDFTISVASASSASSESSAGISKTRKRLLEKAVQVLREWFESKLPHPYATERDEMQNLAVASGLSVTQVKNWIANYRKRVWLRQQRSK